MRKSTVLVTGSNRGIGLALVREFASLGHRVVAGCRSPRQARELEELAGVHPERVTVAQIDVASEESVAASVAELRDAHGHLDILFNNAGVFPEDGRESLEEIPLRHFRDAFETNVLGTLRMVRAFLPLLANAQNPRIVNVSSGARSIADKDDNHYYAYSTSKAALNMLTRAMAAELKPRGITVVAICPGWVKTDMGGENAEITPEESASALVGTALALTLERTSSFLGRSGTTDGYRW
jgi:NAD(P)-dependent dehydrogenase (short-subunit alcohol dehydrogenase family)